MKCFWHLGWTILRKKQTWISNLKGRNLKNLARARFYIKKVILFSTCKPQTRPIICFIIQVRHIRRKINITFELTWRKLKKTQQTTRKLMCAYIFLRFVLSLVQEPFPFLPTNTILMTSNSGSVCSLWILTGRERTSTASCLPWNFNVDIGPKLKFSRFK